MKLHVHRNDRDGSEDAVEIVYVDNDGVEALLGAGTTLSMARANAAVALSVLSGSILTLEALEPREDFPR